MHNTLRATRHIECKMKNCDFLKTADESCCFFRKREKNNQLKVNDGLRVQLILVEKLNLSPNIPPTRIR